MKKIAILMMLVCVSVGLYAQGGSAEFLGNTGDNASKSTAASVKQAPKKGPFYNCGQCSYYDNKTGTCPQHKFELVKEGYWHCPMNFDNGMGEEAGRCPKCGMQMIKMEPRSHKDTENEADKKKE